MLVKDLAKEIRLVEVSSRRTQTGTCFVLFIEYFCENISVLQTHFVVFLFNVGHLSAKHWPHWTTVSWFSAH